MGGEDKGIFKDFFSCVIPGFKSVVADSDWGSPGALRRGKALGSNTFPPSYLV